MKTLVLTNRDILELSMLDKATLEFFMKQRFRSAGFDLRKTITRWYEPSTGDTIYSQKG
jgi:hypothetical protein